MLLLNQSGVQKKRKKSESDGQIVRGWDGGVRQSDRRADRLAVERIKMGGSSASLTDNHLSLSIPLSRSAPDTLSTSASDFLSNHWTTRHSAAASEQMKHTWALRNALERQLHYTDNLNCFACQLCVCVCVCVCVLYLGQWALLGQSALVHVLEQLLQSVSHCGVTPLLGRQVLQFGAAGRRAN